MIWVFRGVGMFMLVASLWVLTLPPHFITNGHFNFIGMLCDLLALGAVYLWTRVLLNTW
jgi:hypothetical protein